MAVEQVGQVLKSKATVWLAPYGTAHPDETSVAANAAWGGSWVKLGFTSEPLELENKFDVAHMNVEQVLGAINRRKISEEVTLKTKIAEVTALNIAYLTGGTSSNVTSTAAGASQVAFEEINIGNNPILIKWAIGFEGINYDDTNGALPVRVFVDRATIRWDGPMSWSQKDDKYTDVGIMIEALADSANSWRMFSWQRVTAPATS